KMTLFDILDKHQLKELLVKCWMTHDASWFFNCVKELDIDTANKLNKAAIKSLAAIEVQRIKIALGLENVKIETFNQLKNYINDAFSVIKGDFMNFDYTFPEKNRLHWEMKKCFAFEGMKRFGLKGKYECGVLYRVSCWLDVLGIPHKIEPKFEECLLYSKEKCSGDITFYF
ncbi:MAG: DUF6125 family protein, partial [Promethearchaeota archaeon]